MKLATAKAIIAGARAHGLRHGFKPLAVVVLAPGGHVIAAECEDGTSMKRFEIAHGKAHGALALGMGSRKKPKEGKNAPGEQFGQCAPKFCHSSAERGEASGI